MKVLKNLCIYVSDAFQFNDLESHFKQLNYQVFLVTSEDDFHQLIRLHEFELFLFDITTIGSDCTQAVKESYLDQFGQKEECWICAKTLNCFLFVHENAIINKPEVVLDHFVTVLNKTYFKANNDLEFYITLSEKGLKTWDPVPTAMLILMDHPALSDKRTEINTLLVELYSNALEHGILEMDSRLKTCSNGMKLYYAERNKRLNLLQSGTIDLKFKLELLYGVKQLVITLSDSGKGFFVEGQSPNHNDFSGRGLSLIQALSISIEYENNGSTVVATFNNISSNKLSSKAS